MKPLGGLHITLVCLAILNMLPTMEVEQSWGLMGVACCLAIGSLIWFARSGGKPLPSVAINIGVLVALVFLLWEMFGPHEEASVHIIDLAHFVALLACCKFFECTSFRDAGLITVIGFLLMAIGALVSASLLFAIVILIDLTFGLGWLIVFHTARMEAQVADRQQRIVRRTSTSPIGPAPSAPATVKRLVGRGLSRVVLVNALYMLLIAAFIFVLMPRGLYGGIFGRMHDLVPGTMTGIGDVVDLDQTGIFEDPTPVMKVQFERGGELVANESFEPYMRAQTFTRYYNGEWRRTPITSPRIVPPTKLRRPMSFFSKALPEGTELITQKVWLETRGNGKIYALYAPIYIGSDDLRVVKLDKRDFILESDNSRGAAHYIVQSAVETSPELTAWLREYEKQRSDGESRFTESVKRFARDLAIGVGDPTDFNQHERIARAIESHLRSSDFEYTLRPARVPRNRDWVDYFLFDSKRGHCEYFASAMVLMCQALDIPARLVSGYQGGELNAAGEYYRFRQKDAHAWVEVFLPEKGWTIFDPTPATSTRRGGVDNSYWARTVRAIDFLKFRWSTWIVSFDRDTRKTIYDEIRLWLANFTQEETAPRSFGELFTSFFYGPSGLTWWQRAGYWLVLVLFVVGLVLLLRVIIILSLLMRERFGKPVAHDRVVPRQPMARFYDRLLVLLASKGHVKANSATPREFAQRVASTTDDLRDLPEYTDWFYAAQYGRQEIDDQREHRLSRFFKLLRENAGFGQKSRNQGR